MATTHCRRQMRSGVRQCRSRREPGRAGSCTRGLAGQVVLGVYHDPQTQRADVRCGFIWPMMAMT